MRSYVNAYNTARRDSGLFNGTFSTRVRLATTANDYFALYARLTSAGDGGVGLSSNNGSNTWKILIYDSSNVLQVNYDTGVTFTFGNVYDIQLVLSGTSVIAKVAGSQVGATQTDSWSTNVQTYVGFGINGNGSTDTIVENISAAP